MATLRNIIGRNIVSSLFYALRIFPIQNKKIYVLNFFGKGYGDSPKYIIQYLIEHYKGYDIVWCVKGEHQFPSGIRTVNIDSYWGLVKSIYEQVTAKIWIDNSRKHVFEKKRKQQYYIQTWHGDIGVKKCQGDTIEKMPQDEITNSIHDSKMADLFVCGNEWMCGRYREAYWFHGEIATCGLPRRDIMYSIKEDQIKSIRMQLAIPCNAKLLLYVPTFRKEDIWGGKLGGYVASFNWNEVLTAFQERFGGEWYGLMRLHPNAAKYSESLNLPTNVINVTDFSDVNELYCICDCCISDYSSSIFEFAVTGKPGFIFASDKNNYVYERGYYFSDEELPFSIGTDINELVANIRNFDTIKYQKRHKLFYQDTIRMYPEGHASEYLAKRIVEICGSK